MWFRLANINKQQDQKMEMFKAQKGNDAGELKKQAVSKSGQGRCGRPE